MRMLPPPRPYLLLIAGTFLFFALNSKAEKYNNVKLHLINSIIVRDTMSPDLFRSYMANLKVSTYYGMPVDSFLTAISNPPLTMFVSSCQSGKNSMYEACYLQVSYYAGLTVRIYVKEFNYLPKYSSTLSWDARLFRKEKIYRISVFKDGKCVNGFCKVAN